MKTLHRIVLLVVLPLLTMNLNAQETCIWTGAVSDDWLDNANWDVPLNPGYGYPTSGDDAIIPDVSLASNTYPIINTTCNAACFNLTVAANASLTITDGTLEVNGDVDNSGNIIVQGNSTFWQDNGATFTAQSGSSFTVSRTGTSDPLKFNMWSSPVAAQSSTVFSGHNAYYFDPASSTADPSDDDNDNGWKVFNSGTMTRGKGYACAGCGTVTFSGTPNFTPQTVTVSTITPPLDPTQPGVKYNLLGNPWPCPLLIDVFLNGANSSNIPNASIYLWDNPASTGSYSTSDYATVNILGEISSGGHHPGSPFTFNDKAIASCQGFFVEIDPSGPDNIINFDEPMRGGTCADNTQFFKQGDIQRMWLGVSDIDSSVYNEILVAFTDSATTGFDKKYDAKKLKGNTKLSLYSVNNDKQYAIQGLPLLAEQEVEVPVGISMDNDIKVTFSLKWEESLDDFDIYLKDKMNGTLIDLRNGDYTLPIPSGEHNGRFSIVMTPKNATGINPIAKKDLSITQSNGVLQIGNHGNELQMLERITIFDLNGKKLKAWNTLTLEANGTISIPFEAGNSGYYLVEVVTAEKTIQQKVRIIN